MNIREQYSLREYGLPSVFSGTNILTTKGGYWYINGISTDKTTIDIPPRPGNELNFYNKPTPYIPPEDRQNVDNYVFQKNLELLNDRINAIHKELTYWDLYKLTASVDNAEDLDAIFSGLSVGQSMVINCPTFTKGGIKYSRGDVIVRTTESSEIKIDALATGLFYPRAIVKNTGNVFTITYSYFEGSPSTSAATAEIEIEHPTEPVQNGVLPASISFKGLTDTPSTIYGLLRTLSPNASGVDCKIGDDFIVLFENGNVTTGDYILPIIKSFDEQYEEISFDKSKVWLELDDSDSDRSNWKWSIHCNANNVKYILKYVQVK